MTKSNISIRRRLGYSLVGLFTISFGILLIATDQIIKRDRLQRHERLVMATAMAIKNEFDDVKQTPGSQDETLDNQRYRQILNNFSATRVLVWLSRPTKDPLFPNTAPVQQFFGSPKLLEAAGVNASGMQKPRSFVFDGQTYFTCSMPLPGNQGVLRFLEDVGVSPAGRQENLIFLLVVWIFAVAIATVLIRRLLTSSLLPLTKLESVMDDMSLRASGLVSDKRVPIESQPSELQGIVKSYNGLADRLQKSWSNQLLFIRAVSHELITPLTLINSSARRLDRHLTDLSESDRKLLASIRKEVWDADHLVRDLVDLARSESGSLKLKLSSVKAIDVIADLSSELEPLAWGDRVLTPSQEDLSMVDTVLISVNSARLRQCIINVLENSSKYSPGDTPIELSITSDDCNICFDVKDYGPGISQEDQRTIFKPFQRGKSDLADVPGSGIGLALVHQIVRLMNGSIFILSSGKSGTIMRFEFPIE